MSDERAPTTTADELERLRALVGPSEESYADLAADVTRAQAVARNALLETGRVRSRIVELERELTALRRDAERVHRRAGMSGGERLRDLVDEAWGEVIRPALRRLGGRVRR